MKQVRLQVARLDPRQRQDWEERAAIMEYDGGFTRERAEQLALHGIKKEMRHAEAKGGDAH